MFEVTKNPYKFKFLVTGVTGPGIPEVYLPPVPSKNKILFKRENKFVREEPHEELKYWIQELYDELEDNPDYIHPHQEEINAWEDQEWERSTEGIWFWNKGVPTYMTGPHYKYCTAWDTYFGFPGYRETDKETFYWIQYWEEDPNSYGGNLVTIRREGKSTKMGFWIMNRASTNFNHFGGMQGEDDTKIRDFYNLMVIDPFYKMPMMYQPKYDTTTLQKKGILFRRAAKRNHRRATSGIDLQSRIDYRTSEEGKYDQAVLHSYAGEEFGKTLIANVDKRWKFVKPCLRRGIFIRGKAFIGTTVEYMNVSGKGGRAFQKLLYESDFDVRGKDGRTTSGLYAAQMPGDCALEGFFDEWGFPDREKAKQWILDERVSVEHNPDDYADLVRKYALNWREAFYVSTKDCEFNSKILQEARSAIATMVTPPYERFDLFWEGGTRFSKAMFRHNPVSGWFKSNWLPTDWNKEANLVDKSTFGGKTIYTPKNNLKFCAGFDPIDHGIVVENQMGEDGFMNARRSLPVFLLKRKYDTNIDGVLTQEILEKNAQEKFPYQTNKYIGMMDERPHDPNILYERCLLICWAFGIQMHVESQKPGVVRYFHEHGCGNFISQKYVALDGQRSRTLNDEGTPASLTTIQEYTGAIATYVQYFGHTIQFDELLLDLLLFKPRKTTEHDYTVSMGFTELAERIKPKVTVKPVLDLDSILPRFDPFGNVLN